MATRNTKTNPKKYLPSAQSKSLDIEPREIVLDPDASMQDGLDSLLGQIMAVYSVSDAEGPLTNRVERFLKRYPHLQVHRDGDTVVASTDLGRKNRVILAGHLDTVPVLDNFPPKWLAPGDPLIDKDVAEMYPSTPVMWGRGATDMKASDAVLLYLAATLTDPKVDLTFVFYDHEEVAAEYNGLGRVVEDHPDWIQGDFAIIGEPTSCGIEAGCNGTMRFDVIANGVAAHSARAWMGEEMAPYFEHLAAAGFAIDRVVAVAGTATSVVSVREAMTTYDSERVHKARVSADELAAIEERLAAEPLAVRKTCVGLDPKRAGVIVAGLVILEEVLGLAGADGYTASESDILKGMILEAARA